MRVVSMVPSWTETLLRAGIDVVGRTRFCVHPPQSITRIPVVGGTKEADWALIGDLKPDLVILDKEENPLEMAEECPIPYLATHVDSLEGLERELKVLAERFDNPYLADLAVLCSKVVAHPPLKWDTKNIPGFMDWVKAPTQDYEKVAYLIWKNPWMGVGSKTYIGSVLKKLGAEVKELHEGEKYPVMELEEIDDCFLLFSSEPFPFHKKIKDLRELNLEGAVVDGECFSWFGVRSLEFLAGYLKLQNNFLR